MGLIKYGNVCLNQIPALATDGTTISSLDELEALIIVFATVSELSETPVENLEKLSNEGWSNNGVLTIIGLTTVNPTPVPTSSWRKPSEKPHIANFVAQ